MSCNNLIVVSNDINFPVNSGYVKFISCIHESNHFNIFYITY